MYKLTIKYYICSGLKSCGLCEGHIPGFWTKNGGEILIDSLSDGTLDAALEDCPTDALQVEEIN